jgi:hypothetical protein
MGQMHEEPFKDALLEHCMLAIRAYLGQVLDDEPKGPARYLRGYIRALCLCISGEPSSTLGAISMVFKTPAYRRTWFDFIDEACAMDEADASLQMTCRFAVEGLCTHHFLVAPVAPSDIEYVQDRLLALTESGS